MCIVLFGGKCDSDLPTSVQNSCQDGLCTDKVHDL